MRTPMVVQSGIVVVFALLLLQGVAGGSYIGVTYAENAASNELDVMQLQTHGLSNVRIYSTDPAVLSSLAFTNIEVVVGVKNDDILEIAESRQAAQVWLAQNILPYVAATKITVIAVGNEVITKAPGLSLSLVQAMRNLHAALVAAKLDKHIKVSTPHSVLLLATSSPPSSGSFHESHSALLGEILRFLSETDAPFLLNVYPFYLHQASKGAVSLDYYLFLRNAGIDDPKTGLHYDNFLDATLDAAVSAMGALNHSDIPIIVSETSWPTRDASSQTYNRNLQNHILNHAGTPMRPDAFVRVYVSDFFNVPMHHLSLGDDWGSGRPQARKLASFVWCIARPNLSDTSYQGALDWACGPLPNQGNVNCGPIQSGQSCYLPNTLENHASWAFNTYYLSHNNTSQSCDFQGTAMFTTVDPSTSTCPYIGVPGSVNGSSGNVTTSAANLFQPQALFQFSTAVALITYLMTGQAF